MYYKYVYDGSSVLFSCFLFSNVELMASSKRCIYYLFRIMSYVHYLILICYSFDLFLLNLNLAGQSLNTTIKFSYTFWNIYKFAFDFISDFLVRSNQVCLTCIFISSVHYCGIGMIALIPSAVGCSPAYNIGSVLISSGIFCNRIA